MRDGDPRDGDPRDGDPRDGDPRDGGLHDGDPRDGDKARDVDTGPSDSLSLASSGALQNSDTGDSLTFSQVELVGESPRQGAPLSTHSSCFILLTSWSAMALKTTDVVTGYRVACSIQCVCRLVLRSFLVQNCPGYTKRGRM